MNFTDLQEECWRFLGQHDTGNRLDWRRQQIKDALNNALFEVCGVAPYVLCMTRETTLSIVNGTAVYTLDDFLARPLSFWTEDSSAHKVVMLRQRAMDRSGERSSSNSYGSNGPWDMTVHPRTDTAYKSGAAASATEGATSITGLAGLDASDIGRMIRLNGEDADYKITAQATTSCTVDRAIRGRLTGVGTSGVGSNYSAVRWELGPVGRFRVKFVPTPTVASTLYYRYLALPRRLVNSDESPAIPAEFHQLLWKGAIKALSNVNEEDAAYMRYRQEYEEALQEFKKRDSADEGDSDEPPHFESSLCVHRRGFANDTYFRGN